MSMVTCQAWRLECHNEDKNEYKQYTGILLPGRSGQIAGHALFGFSRIGSTWQFKAHPGGDAAGKVQSQLRSKRHGGYEDVWNGDVTVPSEWVLDHKSYGRQLQDFIESLYSESVPTGTAGSAPATQRGSGALQPVLDECRSLLSKMAVDPDSAITEYPALVGTWEEVQNQMTVVEGYMDSLRLMLAGQEARQ